MKEKTYFNNKLNKFHINYFRLHFVVHNNCHGAMVNKVLIIYKINKINLANQ